MSKQPITEDDLHALADGRLDDARRAEVESWLSEHPREAAMVTAWRGQNARLHATYDGMLDEVVPARLLVLQTPRFPPLAVAASVAALAVGIAIGFVARDNLPAVAAPLAALPQRAAIAHAVYVPEIRHPVEVGHDQEDHLVAWLSKRLGAPVKPPRLDRAGFALVGGRLLPGESGAVAQFMYQDEGGQRLTLYVGNGLRENGETAFRYAREKGIGVFYWVDGPFGYALSGEQSREKLLDIATLAYRQLSAQP